MYFSKLRTILILISVLAFNLQLLAQTEVKGDIEGIWTQARGPYHVVESARIPEGQVLKIEAGTEVNFERLVSFSVRGTLQVLGTEDNPVIFSSIDPDSLWKGINIVGKLANGGFIRHAQINNSINGLYLSHVEFDIFQTSIDATERALQVMDHANIYVEGLVAVVDSYKSEAITVCCYNSAINMHASSIYLNSDVVDPLEHVTAIYLFHSQAFLSDNHINVNSGSAVHAINMLRNNLVEIDHTSIKMSSTYESRDVISSAIRVESSTARFDHLSIDLNSPLLSQIGIISLNRADVNIKNSIIANTSGVSDKATPFWKDPLPSPSILNASYCCLYGVNTSGLEEHGLHSFVIGNPMWVNSVVSDYHLMESSPCIDQGSPTSPMDPDGTRCDIGKYYYHQNTSSVDDGNRDVPVDFKISNPYPNPFNSSVRFSIYNNRVQDVKINVYDILGRHITTLHNGSLSSGTHEFLWNGKSNNIAVSSGQYILRIESRNYSKARQISYIH